MTVFDNRLLNVQANFLSPSNLNTKDDISALGQDLKLEPLGDLQVTSTGDLDLTFGVRAVIDSLFRRLATPIEGYARTFRTAEGSETYDSEIGNAAVTRLSSGNTGSFTDEVRTFLAQAASIDGRLEVLDVQFIGRTFNNLELNIIYRLRNSSEIRSLGYLL